MSNLNTQIHRRSSLSLIGENALVQGFDSQRHTQTQPYTHTHTHSVKSLPFFILSQQIIRGDITTSITPATTQPSPHSLQLQLPKNHCFHGNWASLTQGPRCGLHEQHADENLPKAAASHSVLPELSQSRAGLLRQCMRPARYNVLYMELTTCARQSFDILSVVADISMMACYNQAAQRWWISSESQTGRLVNFTRLHKSCCQGVDFGLWSCLKNFNNFWMSCHEIRFSTRGCIPPTSKILWLVSMRLTFLTFSRLFWQLLGGDESYFNLGDLEKWHIVLFCFFFIWNTVNWQPWKCWSSSDDP